MNILNITNFGFVKKTLLFMLVMAFTSACSVNKVSSHIDFNDGNSSQWINIDDDNKIVIETSLQGNISMNMAETDIVSFPSNSEIYISIDENGAPEFTINAKSQSNGNFEVEYRLGNKAIKRDEISEQQLKYAWQTFFRMTGVDVAGRTERIFMQTGIDGVITEVNQIKSSSISRAYIENLMEKHLLDTKQTSDVISSARAITSNSNSKMAFISIAEGKRKLSEDEFFQLLNSLQDIESNSHMRDLLITLLDTAKQNNYSKRIYAEFLNSAKHIESNSNLRQFLIKFIDHTKDQDLYVKSIKFAGRHLESNSSLKQFYLALLEKPLKTETLLTLIVSAGEDIESNSNLKSVYKSVLALSPSDAILKQLIQSSSRHIESSSQLYDVLSNIMASEIFNSTMFATMRSAIKNVDSSSKEERLNIQLDNIVNS